MREKSRQYKFPHFFLSPLLAPTMFVKLINKIRNMCGIRFLIFYTYINWFSVSRNLSICSVNLFGAYKMSREDSNVPININVTLIYILKHTAYAGVLGIF